MKTLFINLYRDIITSYPNTEVFNAGKDNILDGYYISLGMSIAEGVSISEYKSLIADFETAKPIEFELFQKQWNELKLVLLGDNPQGEYNFQLSSEYLEWLKINASTVYYKKYQGQHQASIRIDIEELYEDTVDAIRRKVLRFLQENDNYKNFDEFVVNDNIVNRRSKLVRAIKDKYEDNIAFVSYEKWKNDVKENICPNCGKNPCECEPEEPVCPKCGKNPCECVTIKYDEDCNVILRSVVGPSRLQVIKLIKEFYGINLTVATHIVDNVPSVVKESIRGHRALNFKSLAESMGAEVILEKIDEQKNSAEIENGIIRYDDITLGKTTLSELKNKGYQIHRGFYRYDNKRSYASEFKQYSGSYIVIDNWDNNDIDDWCEYCFANPSIVNRDTLINTQKVVTYFSFNWNDCPFLVHLGFYGDDVDYDTDEDEENYEDEEDDKKTANEIAELFEDNGYIRIEPLMNDDSEHNITLVKPKLNINGDYVFIRITDYDKTIEFYSNLVTEWVSEKTGKIFRPKENSTRNRNRGIADNDDFPSEISNPFPIIIHGYTVATFLDVVKKSFGLKGSRVTFSALSRKTEKLVEKLEDAFGFYIPEEEFEEWNCLDDILISLERRAFE